MRALIMTTAFYGALLLAAGTAQATEIEIQPVPREVKVNAEKAALGEKLYHDTKLSVDGTISCASCHDLKKGGTDQAVVSTGVKGQLGPINSPTVYNSANNFVQFWDGRAKDLAEQALGPVENPKEMGEKWDNVVKKLQADETYAASFKKIYGKDVITKENVADAIAEFEKTLITPDSRFDDYLRGDEKALSALEKKGFELFQDKGCMSCHTGTYFGGESYQAMAEEYFTDRGNLTDADYGRYNVTKDEADKHMFKVPMLRNVAVTAPYFHDGSKKTLEEAVQAMAKYQLGEELTKEDNQAIVAFLKTLTGKYKGKPLDKM